MKITCLLTTCLFLKVDSLLATWLTSLWTTVVGKLMSNQMSMPYQKYCIQMDLNRYLSLKPEVLRHRQIWFFAGIKIINQITNLKTYWNIKKLYQFEHLTSVFSHFSKNIQLASFRDGKPPLSQLISQNYHTVPFFRSDKNSSKNSLIRFVIRISIKPNCLSPVRHPSPQKTDKNLLYCSIPSR